MSRKIAILMMIVFAILAIVFCLMAVQASMSGSDLSGYEATAVYGAKQFHIQLTAIAGGQ